MWSDTEEDFKDLYPIHEEPMSLDVRAGDEWLVGVNLKENYYYTPEKIGVSRAVNSYWNVRPIFIPEILRVQNK